MRAKLPKILITGSAGFIGSAFFRLLAKGGRASQVILFDKLTYAADLKRLEGKLGDAAFYKGDIADKKRLALLFCKEKPDIVVNFAAQTHVDRSIRDARDFLRTNVIGTHELLEASRASGIAKFIHISTDEVYGEIEKGKFRESSNLNANSPYSASKASADLLIKSYIRTYNFPALIIRPSNNYGPWQYPEKLIPLAVLKVLRREKVPIYARGENVREWLYVEDCAKGIYEIMQKGRLGEAYNLGSGKEYRNIEVVRLLLKVLGKDKRSIQFVKDRPGHDFRYSLDSSKIRKEIGWKPQVGLEQGLRMTVNWCLRHKLWLMSKWKNIAYLYKG